MSQLRGSLTYIWSLADVLGQGATGAVYKGRHKMTGEVYAIKTFNQMSHMRPLDVQMREFDVLQRLNHENIVRLLAIEEETSSTGKVLVMELCSGGSLYHILEEPENMFGLEEQEYFLVLHDVSAALNHLRENGIVHRDIKPGNIMKYTSDSGRSVYKLIDFGAARQLQEEEQFMSLYGTEEYLHPDMYERAVLRRPMSKQFSASVDLWSLGVTFYHVATGSLPFRPYGGRKNKETMFKITTQKESGVISGVQHTPDGPIDWSRELPDSCRLSLGARNLITPLLAGLTECNPQAMWSYEEFFAEVERILSKKLIYVLDLSHCEMLHIYMDVTDTYASLQEVVAAQTDIHASHQLLLYENLSLSSLVELTQPIGTYPETSADNPILLYYNEATAMPQPPSFCIPEFPPVSPQVILDADPSTAKVCCGIMCLLRRHITQYIKLQHFISRANHSFHLVLSRDVERLQDFVVQFGQLVDSSGQRVASFIQHSRLHACLLDRLTPGGTPQAEAEQFDAALCGLRRDFQDMAKALKEKRHYVDDYFEKVVRNKELVGKHRVLPACQESDRCVSKLDILIEQGLQTMVAFRRNKTLKRLSHNEEQIHRFDKIKLKENSTKALSVFTDHCQPNLKKTFLKFVSWYSCAGKAREKVRVLESQLEQLTDRHAALCDRLQQAERQQVEELEEKMRRMTGQPPVTSTNDWEMITPSSGGGNTTRPSSHLLKQLTTRLGQLKSESAAVRMAVEENNKLIRELDTSQSMVSSFSARNQDSVARFLD